MLEPIENVLEISVFVTHIAVVMHYDFSHKVPEKIDIFLVFILKEEKKGYQTA